MNSTKKRWEENTCANLQERGETTKRQERCRGDVMEKTIEAIDFEADNIQIDGKVNDSCLKNPQIEQAAVNKSRIKAFVMAAIRLIFRPKIYYEDGVNEETAFVMPSILVANHTFALNGAVIGTLLDKEEICFLLAKDMFKGRLLTKFYLSLGCLPIDRQKADTAWLHQAKQMLKEGKHICLFPEGKVNRHGAVDNFKPGFVMLASITGAQIVPMYIEGKNERLLSRQSIIVGKPIPVADGKGMLSTEQMKAKAQEYRETVLKLRDELHQKQYK